jgi:polysaccharide pyruvyl transferase WcaK-like protein
MPSNASRPLRLYILCGNAAYNRGDRANLLTQIRLIRERFPDADITLDSFDPEVDACRYGVRVVKRALFLSREQFDCLKRADAVIWGGGALLADNACMTLVPWWYVMLVVVKGLLKKPVMAWSHGVVLETAAGRFFAARALNSVDIISVRDRNSLETVNRLHLKQPAVLTADPVVCLQPSAAERGRELLAANDVPQDGRPLIGICPTFWPFYHRSSDLIPYMFGRKFRLYGSRNRKRIERHNRTLREVVDILLQRHDARIVFFPRYPCAPWPDVELLRGIAAGSVHPERVSVIESDKIGPADYFAMFHVFSGFICTAMHDAIVATILGRPCVHLYYEQKGLDFFSEIGALSFAREWRCLFEEDGAAETVTLLETALEQWPAAWPEISRNLTRLQEQAALNIQMLATLIAERCRQ